MRLEMWRQMKFTPSSQESSSQEPVDWYGCIYVHGGVFTKLVLINNAGELIPLNFKILLQHHKISYWLNQIILFLAPCSITAVLKTRYVYLGTSLITHVMEVHFTQCGDNWKKHENMQSNLSPSPWEKAEQVSRKTKRWRSKIQVKSCW